MSNSQNSQSILEVRKNGAVCHLILNCPEKFNALSEMMLDALQANLDKIEQDSSIHCVVISANGRAFCAGHDLKQMQANPSQVYYQQLFERCSNVMQSITRLSVPVIAQVQGLATAAGCQLVASCDIAVASDNAQFAVSGINVGLFCSTPAVALSRNINTKDAFKMLVTGEFIDAQTARDRGLVNQVVQVDDLPKAVNEIAQAICSKSPSAIKIGKEMFYKQKQMGLADAYQYAANIMACNMKEADASEGIDAFIEKRKPVWQ